MMRKALLWLVMVVAAGMMGNARAADYAEKAGSREVGRMLATWKDGKRDREVPVLICYPKDLGKDGEKAPVILFSHGLGGSRLSYEEYGTHWASYGYVVIFPQHHGSDTQVIGHGMLEMMQTGKGGMEAFLDRVGDVHFVLDQVEAMNAGKMEGKEYELFKDRLDVKKIGMAGHSFGAITTQAIVGEFTPAGAAAGAGAAVKLTDDRVKAALAMSPSPAKGGLLAGALGKVTTPTFFMTGTNDQLMGTTAEMRRSAFDESKFPETYLLLMTGADHMTFTPTQRPRDNRDKEMFQKYIQEASTAYWDAFLKEDAKAKEWLVQQFPKELGAVGKFEKK